MDSVHLILDLVQSFQIAFSQPSYRNFSHLLLAWILTPGRRTITALLRWNPLEPRLPKPEKHFSVFHRFFSRARWCPDRLGEILLKHLLTFVEGQVVLLVDDTLCRRSGPRILGAGMHYDPLSSTYAGKAGRRIALSFGVNFVLIAIWVPFRYCRAGGLAVPLLFRLYRPRSVTRKAVYKKRTALAVELIQCVTAWLEERQILVVADQEYACRTVLRQLPKKVQFIGSLPANARLHDPEVPPSPGRGRPRLWGERIPTPAEYKELSQVPWQELCLELYGHQIVLLVKEFLAVWRSAGPDRALKVIIVRDPRGQYQDKYFFTTDTSVCIPQALKNFTLRWAIEVLFRNTKQCLGLETTQNGWTKSTRPRKKVPGPQADKNREPTATSRTAPFAWIAYGVVVVWYLHAGAPEEDIARVRRQSPWYRHKQSVSFQDMLFAFRKCCLRRIFEQPANDQGCQKNLLDQVCERLCAA